MSKTTGDRRIGTAVGREHLKYLLNAIVTTEERRAIWRKEVAAIEVEARAPHEAEIARLREALNLETAMPWKRWGLTIEGDWEEGFSALAWSRPIMEAGTEVEVTGATLVETLVALRAALAQPEEER